MANETLTDVFSDIADAVRAKGVTGQMTPLQMPAKITSIPSGGETPEAEWKDVNFIDYDGKNLYSYTTAEALALTELPPAPDRTSKGLTFQEWNYTLAQMKENTGATGGCTVGATYLTTDGDTKIHITIYNSEYSLFRLYFRPDMKSGYYGTPITTINWGDGTSDTATGSGSKNIDHQYHPDTYPKQYVISLHKGTNGQCLWWNNVITKSPDNYTLNEQRDSAYLTRVDKFYSGTDNKGYTERLFDLTNITEVSWYGNGETEQYIGPSFDDSVIQGIVIPNGVTSSQVCRNASSLNVVSLPYGFTSIGTNCFNNCKRLGYISLPNTVNQIGNNAFNNCYSLGKLVMPQSLASIGSQAFQYCSGLLTFDCSACSQVPTLANSNAFSNTNANLKIIVPDALYDTWIGASNWSSLASKIVKASEA